MKNFKRILILIVFAVFSLLLFSSCERIDAGHEGMKVNLYGSNRGVDDVSLVTGWVYYNPLTTKIYEYPTFVQTIDYEPFSINAKDGSEFIVDPTMSLRMQPGEGPKIFIKYRKELIEVIETTLYNHVKDAFRVELNSFTTDEIVSERAKFEENLENSLRATLEREGFILEQLTSGLKYPESIVESVNRKNKAIQDGIRAENELKVAEAEAAKLIAIAKGEKEANELRTIALTPAVLKAMWIEKWDGSMPKVVSGVDHNFMIGLN